MTESEQAYVDALKLQIQILETLLMKADLNTIANMREKGKTNE